MKRFVLFDLGGTLVQYYEKEDFPDILKSAIFNVGEFLLDQDILIPPVRTILRRAREEDYESSDYRVRPLENRLNHIFELDRDEVNLTDEMQMSMCRLFMEPIFAIGKCYEDSNSTLENLKSRGISIAIVSNTPWGSPSYLWREEIERHGLSEFVDLMVFCRDVGWRKPAKQVFKFALQKLEAEPEECIFVGDNPQWDLVGAESVGIDAVLIARGNLIDRPEAEIISNLNELTEK